jgi:hypothetical protein
LERRDQWRRRGARAAIMMWLAAQPRIMGELTIGLPLKIGGWIATAIVAAGVVTMGIVAALDLVR